MWFIYILLCADNTYYTGITTDLLRREDEHNNSQKGAKYTKMRRPVKIVYSENYKNRSEASKRECEIKKMTRTEKSMLINKNELL